MDADQILDLADLIIDSAHEDQLSVEDILLFLKDLLMGKYGKVSNGLDYPAFFEIFEEYRNERYRAIKKQRWEEHLTHKSLGDAHRAVDDLPLKKRDDPNVMLDLMQTYYENRDNE